MDKSDQNRPAVAMSDEQDSNPSSNPWFADIVEQRYGRRGVVKGGIAAAVTTLIAGPALAGGSKDHHDKDRDDHDLRGHHTASRIDPGFSAVAAFNEGREDQVVAPEGYSVQVLIPEGTPLTHKAPAYIPGDYNTGADRESQTGAHHDGMHFFPMARGHGGNQHGVLCLNFENIDQAFIHPNGFTRGSDGSRPVEDEVRKEVASHGVGVVELMKHRRGGEWKVVPGKLNRRITGQTPMDLTGPARGSDLLKTKYSPKGNKTRGTLIGT